MKGTLTTIKEAGHDLDLAITGSQALAKLRRHAQDYDLVILDLMLPKGTPEDAEDALPDVEPERVGLAVLSRIAEKWPSLSVLVITAIRSDLEGSRVPSKCRIMTKPILIRELLREIDSPFPDNR
jgi:DNA-binding response OmpR family regulator